MSEQDLKPVSAGTGTFAILQTGAPREAAERGKALPEGGTEAPQKLQSVEALEELAAELNRSTTSIGRDLRFEVDMESGRSVIQVLDRETGELIRQIPPEKARTYLNGSGAVQLRLYDDRV